MKRYVLCATMLMVSSLGCYQPSERGLFYTHFSQTPIYLQKQLQLVYEKKEDQTESRVIVINGLNEFEQFVILTSSKKPVIVLVHAPINPNSQKLRPLFQEKADQDDRVVFASLNVFDKKGDELENYQILAQRLNLNQIDLPTFLLFKDGNFEMPQQIPEEVNVHEYLEKLIEKLLGQDKLPVVPQDLTATSTDQQKFPIKTPPPPQSGQQPKKGIWKRLKEYLGGGGE